MAKEFIIKKSASREEFISSSTDLQFALMDMAKDADVKVVISRKQRTNKQNKAMRRGWQNGAKALNDAGWTRNATFKIRRVELPHTDKTFEHDFWRPLQSALGLPNSTADLSTTELSAIWERLRDQIIVSTTEHDNKVDIGEFPSTDGLISERGLNVYDEYKEAR